MLFGNALAFGWNRPIPGREKVSLQHFQDMVTYLSGLQRDGKIAVWEPIFFASSGSNFNGMFFLRGETAQLTAVLNSEEWTKHIMRASLHLQDVRVTWAVTGENVMKLMPLWGESVEKYAK